MLNRSVKRLAIRGCVVKTKQLVPTIVSIVVVSRIACDLLTHLYGPCPERIQRFAVRALAFAHQAPCTLTLFAIRLLKEGREGGEGDRLPFPNNRLART